MIPESERMNKLPEAAVIGCDKDIDDKNDWHLKLEDVIDERQKSPEQRWIPGCNC